jgi:uncharacterized protein (TIGR02271 family)
MPDPQSADATLPLVEEQLSVEKRKVETGRVRISTVVDERQEWVRENLIREEVSIERVRMERLVDQPPPMRQDGDMLIIPLVEEVLVVEKKLMLREELRIRTQRHTDKIEQPVTLKSTRAVIQRE